MRPTNASVDIVDIIDPKLKLSSHITDPIARATFCSRLFSKLGSKRERKEGPAKSKGPLGLNTLYDPKDEALVDIIFVHGLAGGSQKTWSDSRVAGSFWPQSWLPKDPDFKHARIHSFGYDADWRDRGLSIMSIHDFGQTLLSEMRNNPSIRKSKNGIIMVGHSMGGCVAKMAYVLARRNPSFESFASRFRSFFFLATPHRGSSLATLIRTVLFFAGVSKPYLGDLSAYSAALEDLNGSFVRHIQDLRLPVWSFYETRPVLTRPKVIVVKQLSATLGYEQEKILPLDADHRRVCKYQDVNDPNYRSVRCALSTAVGMVKLQAASFVSTEARLGDYLGVDDSYQDDISLFLETKLPDTCTWLEEREAFKSWLLDSPGSSSVLWLTGQPGAGKSIISSHVVDLLRLQGRGCCYYFFHQGQAGSAGLGPLLTHLAYQMALVDAAVRRKIFWLQDNGVSWQPHDDRSIWRKLFIQGILDVSPMSTHFWVIDGLDECSGAPAFTKLLSQIPRNIRVLVASRNTPEIDRGLLSLNSVVDVYQITREDTNSDVESVIRAGLRMLSLHDVDELGSRILSRSAGSFIWVRLVLQELETASTIQEVEGILDDVPDDLHEFYHRIVRSIETEKRRARIAKAILFFVVLAIRPMTTDELCKAIHLDIGKRLGKIDQIIRLACGQLVAVDQAGRVRMIHETARRFLLSETLNSGLAVSRDQGHSRIVCLCLSYIDGILNQQLEEKAVTGVRRHHAPFLNYASTAFSKHLLESEKTDAQALNALLRFVDRSIYYWIEYIAEDGATNQIMRTSMDISRYIADVACEGAEKLKSWAVDLSRVDLTFRDQLRKDPSAIHDLIPPLCPAGTSIATSVDKSATIKFLGLQSATWNDSFVRIEAKDVVAVAYGETYLAVGMLNGEIAVYDATYLQYVIDLHHPGLLLRLEFGCRDKYLASACNDYVLLWNPRSGAPIHVFECLGPKALSFSHDALLVAQKDGQVLHCNLTTLAVQGRRWLPISSNLDWPWGNKSTQEVVLSKSGLLAATFWTNDAFVFNVDTGVRGLYSGPSGAVIRAMTLNQPHDALIVSYTGDRLAVFDIFTMKMCQLLSQVPAYALACSPDGRYVMAGTKGSQHTIEIYQIARTSEVVTLTPVHCINYPYRDIVGVVASDNNLRFATTHGNECRIWDPSRSLEELAGTAGKEIEPNRGEISAMTLTSDGQAAVCGTEHGEVVVFSTMDGSEIRTIHRDGNRDFVTEIVLVERETQTLIAIALRESYPPGWRLVIAQITQSRNAWGPVGVLFQTEGGPSQIDLLLVSPTKDRLLVVNGSRILLLELPLGNLISEKEVLRSKSVMHTVRQDPLDDGILVVYDEADAYSFRWSDLEPADGRRVEMVRDGPVLTYPETRKAFHYQNQEFTVEVLINHDVLSEGNQQGPAQLTGWRRGLDPCHGLQHLGRMIRCGLCISGRTFVFVDTDLWICTVDLDEFASTGLAKRHFFLLPEWTTSNGWIRAGLMPTGGLVFVNRRGVVVVEGWLSTWQMLKLSSGHEGWEVVLARQRGAISAEQ